MKQSLPPENPLRRLFAATVEHVLYVDVGMSDPQIADYLTNLLSGFVHVDDLFPFHDAAGRPLEDLAEIVADSRLDQPVPPNRRQRIIHRHIGDFALFWTGLYPEGLRRMRRRAAGDRLAHYLQQGKRSYALASQLTLDPDDEPPAPVLQRLSDHFEFCVYGLNLCRKEWDALRAQAKPI